MQGVLLVMGQQDTSWNNMKKFLGSKAVKDEVRATISSMLLSRLCVAAFLWGRGLLSFRLPSSAK